MTAGRSSSRSDASTATRRPKASPTRTTTRATPSRPCSRPAASKIRFHRAFTDQAVTALVRTLLAQPSLAQPSLAPISTWTVTYQGRPLQTQEPWKIVTPGDLRQYPCGAAAGDTLRLQSKLIIRDSAGRPTGKSHPAGSVWRVLADVAAEPDTVWLREPNGDSHTWDGQSLWDTFERADQVGHA